MKISLTKEELNDLRNSSNDPHERDPDVWVTEENKNKDRISLFVLLFIRKSFTFEVEVVD